MVNRRVENVSERPLTRIEDIRPGARWLTNSLTELVRWEALYEQDLSSLFIGTATVANGLKVADLNYLIPENWFRISSHFYFNAVCGQRPGIETSNKVLANWLDQQWPAIEDAAKYWAICGRIVLLVENTGELSLRSVKPGQYTPIRAEYDKDLILGHVIGYPYFSGPDTNRIKGIDNRIRLIIAMDGQTPEVRTYRLDGVNLGTEIMAESGPGGPVGIFADGDVSDSFYPDLIPLVTELVKRQSILARILNQNAMPHLVLPQGLTGGVTGDALLDATGSIISLVERENSVKPEYLQWDSNLNAHKWMVEHLIQQIHICTGISPVVFGIDAGKGESGAARDKLNFTWQSKVNKVRRQLESILQGIAANFFGGSVTIHWPNDPTASVESLHNQVRQDFQSGIISLEQAQALLGYEVEPMANAEETTEEEGEEENA